MAARGARRSPRATRSNHTPPGAARSGRVPKTPRFGAYEKLIHRFYEPLILLEIFGRTRGERDVDPGNPSTPRERRRRLLKNLSYLCDNVKGGDSTAAIGLEENPKTYRFWLASNATRSDDKVKKFLIQTLAKVKGIIQTRSDRREDDVNGFVRTCIQFATQRIYKEQALLIQKIEHCKQYLSIQESINDKLLWAWLRCFCDREQDYEALCLNAYVQRRMDLMKYMETKIDSAREAELDHVERAFQEVRHYIGRLSDHVRAPKHVIEDALKLPSIFEVYEVARVPQMPNIDAPKADALTTPEGILNRMGAFRNEDTRREYEEYLSSMNLKWELGRRILEQYDQPSFKPRVHAEIQVLEHFYQNDIKFADDDRYIGCSKLACFCCSLYFRHHPMSMVELDAHYNIWLNWGPPALLKGAEDEWYIHQRNILQGMLETIRKEVLNQVKNKVEPLNWHADSLTGITQSILSDPPNHHSFPTTQSMVSEPSTHYPLPTIEESFDALSINQSYASTSDTEVNRPSSPSYSSLSSARVAGSTSSQQSEAPSDDDSSDDDSDDGGGAYIT